MTVSCPMRRASPGSWSSAAATLVSGPTATSSRSSASFAKRRTSASTAGSTATGAAEPSRMPWPSWPNHANRDVRVSGSLQPGCTGTSVRPPSARTRAAIRARSVLSPLTVVTATSSSSGDASASARASASSTSVPISVSSTIRRCIVRLYDVGSESGNASARLAASPLTSTAARIVGSSGKGTHVTRSGSVACTAQEYHADGTIRPARYSFDGTIDGGWEVRREGKLHLQLGPGYRILEVSHCGICSTDLARHHLPFPLPQVTGHEVVARDESGRTVVVEINASHVARGLEPAAWCAHCRAGLARHCPARL